MFELIYLDLEENKEYEKIIEPVLKECFRVENLEKSKLTVQITLTNPKNIREFNNKYRKIDKETDVL